MCDCEHVTPNDVTNRNKKKGDSRYTARSQSFQVPKPTVTLRDWLKPANSRNALGTRRVYVLIFLTSLFFSHSQSLERNPFLVFKRNFATILYVRFWTKPCFGYEVFFFNHVGNSVKTFLAQSPYGTNSPLASHGAEKVDWCFLIYPRV